MGSLAGSTDEGRTGLGDAMGSLGGNPGMTGNSLGAAGRPVSPLVGLDDISLGTEGCLSLLLLRFSGWSSLLKSSLTGPSSPGLGGLSSGDALCLSISPIMLSADCSLGLFCSLSRGSPSSIDTSNLLEGDKDLDLDLLLLAPINVLVNCWCNDKF